MAEFRIYPAIDIRGGKCVRLLQGDYNQETVYGDSPVEMAKRWEKEGASWVHLVDLDGAKAGQPVMMRLSLKWLSLFRSLYKSVVGSATWTM